MRKVLDLGVAETDRHIRELSGRVWQGLHEGGWELMTSGSPDHRAGNICFTAPNVDEITSAFEKRKIIIWGSYAGVKRVRVSTHVYNSDEDVDCFLEALSDLYTWVETRTLFTPA